MWKKKGGDNSIGKKKGTARIRRCRWKDSLNVKTETENSLAYETYEDGRG